MMAPKSILAITATAGPRVIDDICQTIGIQTKNPEESVTGSVQSESIKVIQKGRDNIDVSCQFVASQEERLLMVRDTAVLHQHHQHCSQSHYSSTRSFQSIYHLDQRKTRRRRRFRPMDHCRKVLSLCTSGVRRIQKLSPSTWLQLVSMAES